MWPLNKIIAINVNCCFRSARRWHQQPSSHWIHLASWLSPLPSTTSPGRFSVRWRGRWDLTANMSVTQLPPDKRSILFHISLVILWTIDRFKFHIARYLSVQFSRHVIVPHSYDSYLVAILNVFYNCMALWLYIDAHNQRSFLVLSQNQTCTINRSCLNTMQTRR